MTPDVAELHRYNREPVACEHPADQVQYLRSGGYCPEPYCNACRCWVLSGRPAGF